LNTDTRALPSFTLFSSPLETVCRDPVVCSYAQHAISPGIQRIAAQTYVRGFAAHERKYFLQRSFEYSRALPFFHTCSFRANRAGGASDDDSEMTCALGSRRTLSSTSPLSSSALSSQTTTPSSSEAPSSQTTLQSPSRSTTQDAEAVRRCGQCHRTGHNARTCPRRLVQTRRQCRSCQQPGHDARTCPSRLVQASRQCRSCQQPGHDARTCRAA
jgi:hypothetical protein